MNFIVGTPSKFHPLDFFLWTLPSNILLTKCSCRMKSLTCNFRASINRSWCCSMVLMSVIPDRSGVNSTTAENSPISVSFRAKLLNALVKLIRVDTNSLWKWKQKPELRSTGLSIHYSCLLYVSESHQLSNEFLPVLLGNLNPGLLCVGT